MLNILGSALTSIPSGNGTSDRSNPLQNPLRIDSTSGATGIACARIGWVSTNQIDGPVLVVRAESTDDGVSVTWIRKVDGERLAVSLGRLSSFLDWISDRPAIMSGKPFNQIPGMPDAVGSLRIEVDERRVERGLVEPNAAERGDGAVVGFDSTESVLPTVGRWDFGPPTQSGSATTWSNLVDAIRRVAG